MAKIVENIIIGGEFRGEIVGINLNPIDYQDEKQLQDYISNINKLKSEDSKNIYIEDMEGLTLKIKRKIEMETGLIFPNSLELKLYNMKLIFEELIKKKEFSMEEVLIICRDRDIVFKIISLLHHMFPFISIPLDIEDGEDIGKEILKDIGLSVFTIKDINKSLKTYDIIINVEEEPEVEPEQIKKDTIICDFSNNHIFRNTKKCFLIEDIGISNENYVKNSLLSKYFTSSLYENLTGEDKKSFDSIYSRDKFCTLDEIIKCDDNLKGNM